MSPTLISLLGRIIIVSGQILIIAAAFSSAMILRYDYQFINDLSLLILPVLLPLLFIKLTCFYLTHLLSGWWKYVSIHDLLSLVKGNLLSSAVFFVYVSYYVSGLNLSWTVVVLDGVMCFLFMSGSRVAVRLYSELMRGTSTSYKHDKKILIIGAGASGQSIVREIRQNPKLNWKVIGYVDQDLARQNQWFQGVPVIATVEGLSKILRDKRPDKVIMANPGICHKELRLLVAECNSLGIKTKIIPKVGEILNDHVSIQNMRDVQLEDLLGRASIQLDVDKIEKYIEGKNVLISGAAGSIGSEICRQVAGFGAYRVILLDNAETPLFNIERELTKSFPRVRFVACLNDVSDAPQVESTFANYRPDVIFHAAAYKHVSMSENNPLTAIANNALGTRVLAKAADRYNVERFVMVSTDKAVNPTNIMGASKRTAEVYVQSAAKKSKTKMVTVRFGNVLGSNGSVVPIFQEQIRNGGPVTVTDPEVTRFFMTIPEASQLVLQAGSMGSGGEIFILDMGEPIHITHLAEELIRLSGMVPYEDIDIEFTGLRPGEKLHEELLHLNEGVFSTSHEKICVANSCSLDLVELNQLLDDLSVACQSIDLQRVMKIVTKIVPEYRPVVPPGRYESKIFKIKRPKAFISPAKHMDIAGNL